MKHLLAGFSIGCTVVIFMAPAGFSQLLDDNNKDSIRVTVTINPDRSRTTYEYDNQHHRAIASTTENDGKLRGKIRYEIDDAGRFSSGMIFGPDGKFRFKSLYKYDNAGRLDQETHLNEGGGVINKLVYHYDPAGKSAGYSIYDASGTLVANSSTPTPTPKPSPRVIR
jgi:YD repeat-containing protein